MSEPQPQPRPRFHLPTSAFAVLLAVGVVVAALVESSRAPLLRAGTGAPGADLVMLDGKRVSLESFKGKYVLVDFWATWCPPCVSELPYLVRVAAEHAPRGLVFLAVNQGDETPAKVGAFAGKIPGLAAVTAFAPGGLPPAWAVSSLPTLYLVDPQGRVLEGVVGALDEEALRELLDKHLPRAAR
jgi:thiol-disulfide isomerase/thioredoxin